MKDRLTVKEAKYAAGVSTAAIYRYIKVGKLKSRKEGGRRVILATVEEVAGMAVKARASGKPGRRR